MSPAYPWPNARQSLAWRRRNLTPTEDATPTNPDLCGIGALADAEDGESVGPALDPQEET